MQPQGWAAPNSPGAGTTPATTSATTTQAHNAIVISRVFDHPRVPRYVVEYIVFHEMLHLKHPVKLRGSRRCVHSREFLAEETLFPDLSHAKKFLTII